MRPSGNFAWLQRTKVERLGASAIAKRNFRIKRVGKIHCPIPLTPSLSRRERGTLFPLLARTPRLDSQRTSSSWLRRGSCSFSRGEKARMRRNVPRHTRSCRSGNQFWQSAGLVGNPVLLRLDFVVDSDHNFNEAVVARAILGCRFSKLTFPNRAHDGRGTIALKLQVPMQRPSKTELSNRGYSLAQIGKPLGWDRRYSESGRCQESSTSNSAASVHEPLCPSSQFES